MTFLTALELAGNYPEDILINAAQQENGKYAGFCYLLRDGEIHKLMLNTKAGFNTEQEATDFLHEAAKWSLQYFKLD